MYQGRVVFGAMDEVVFGPPASEAIVEQTDSLNARRAFLMVSGTLTRETDEIEKIRHALGPRCVGTFDAMPPRTPERLWLSTGIRGLGMPRNPRKIDGPPQVREILLLAA